MTRLLVTRGLVIMGQLTSECLTSGSKLDDFAIVGMHKCLGSMSLQMCLLD